MGRFEAVAESISVLYAQYKVSLNGISMAILARFGTSSADITLVATEKIKLPDHCTHGLKLLLRVIMLKAAERSISKCTRREGLVAIHVKYNRYIFKCKSKRKDVMLLRSLDRVSFQQFTRLSKHKWSDDHKQPSARRSPCGHLQVLLSRVV